MRLSTSTAIAFNRIGGKKMPIPECLRVLKEAGYRVIDMNFHDAATFSTPLSSPSWLDWIYEIKDTADSLGLEFSQSHLHFYDYTDSSFSLRDEKEELIRRGIIGSGILGVRWAVTHAATDFASSTPYRSSKAKALEYFPHLLESAEKNGIGLCIENLWDQNIAPLKRYTANAEETCELVELLSSSNCGVCWDMEHADIMKQDQRGSLLLVGDKLKATHISDNKGKDNDHTLPFLGSTDWFSFTSALKEINYKGDFTYEVLHYADNMPDELLLPALKLSVEVGNYLLSL